MSTLQNKINLKLILVKTFLLNGVIRFELEMKTFFFAKGDSTTNNIRLEKGELGILDEYQCMCPVPLFPHT